MHHFLVKAFMYPVQNTTAIFSLTTGETRKNGAFVGLGP